MENIDETLLMNISLSSEESIIEVVKYYGQQRVVLNTFKNKDAVKFYNSIFSRKRLRDFTIDDASMTYIKADDIAVRECFKEQNLNGQVLCSGFLNASDADELLDTTPKDNHSVLDYPTSGGI